MGSHIREGTRNLKGTLSLKKKRKKKRQEQVGRMGDRKTSMAFKENWRSMYGELNSEKRVKERMKIRIKDEKYISNRNICGDKWM